jgi:hypothetical protein
MREKYMDSDTLENFPVYYIPNFQLIGTQILIIGEK